MNKGRWLAITPTSNIPPQEGRAVNIEGREIALFNLDGRFLAVDNACPHKSGPLCDGLLSGNTVVCPLHGQRFDLETGLPVMAAQSGGVATIPAKVENGIVMLCLPGNKESAAA
jgi:NAD(P)H-dependent nitrite reductase small subunit